ncbi:hypothetical protein [Deinococcus cellulosilyticus]|uniref:Uncharacterized protein n=1 Tax=Deinococcus cellulosilyticus (strain DSM 18568 / NBRC 106333 / KACC 11606 / 5516J-15) TaxID=1223518 RepID=A0A511N6M3_DEIC1|nr:hypothetical protein [Deinococcus cellulosilyticus]GEM48494.1 hypothetical protein DC3_41290 [Deinococcus cellulosilyticus NBRC 106333 = KACC 11606]
MQEGFLEVLFPTGPDFDLDARDDFEGWISGMLYRSELGEVTGAGMGDGVAVLDIEIAHAELTPQAVQLLLELLRRKGAPAGTLIHERQPVDQVHRLI